AGDQRILLRRGQDGGAPTIVAAAAPAPIAAPNPATAPAPSAAPAPAAAPEGTYIVSPFVGTFYRSSGPDAPSFVEVGQSVSVGQTLCIVEAMKLFNELEA